MADIMDIVDRAAKDQAFLEKLVEDPFGTAKAEGYDVSLEQARAFLGMPEATEEQIVGTLQERMTQLGKGRSFHADCSSPRAVAGVRG